MANLRRPGPDDKGATKPPAKRQRTQSGQNHVLPTKLDELTYRHHIRSMQVTSMSDARGRSSISHLMIVSIPNRMEWIKQTKPSTKSVLDEFPHLKDSAIVSSLVNLATYFISPNTKYNKPSSRYYWWRMDEVEQES